MPPQPQPLHLRIFLSSPGDVMDERKLALNIFEQLQYDPLLRGLITIEAVAWDKPGGDTPMLATITPQDAINRGLPKPSECDIVVVIFWSRMGTPLPDTFKKPDGSLYLSGTEWEFEDAMQASRTTGKPEVVVYRRTEKILLDPDAPDFDKRTEQRRRVNAFFDAFGNVQGYNPYQNPTEFADKFETHLKKLIKHLLEQQPFDSTQTPPQVAKDVLLPLWQGSPFPGLRAFTPADEPIYFGRGAETDALIKGLSETDTQLIAVVGASGSGKSSLVGAGLIPRLAGNAIPGSKDWLLPDWKDGQWVGLRFTPGELGDNPFMALAAKVAPMLQETPRQIADTLAKDPAALEQITRQLLEGQPEWAEVFLFIDQFEELFSLVGAAYIAPFIDFLEAASKTERIRTVITLRGDFYGRAIEEPTLAELLKSSTFPLAAPTQYALGEMITRPAARAGLGFEPGLAERILRDTGTDPGALALMAYALDELYHLGSSDKQLTHEEYDALDGVQGAIGKRAESVFITLDAEAQNSLPDVFSAICEVDERGVAIRRRASLSQVARTGAARELVDALTEARLLIQDNPTISTTNIPNSTPESIVEVAHEALLRSWKRLADWIEEAQDDLRLLRQVRGGAEEWKQRKGDLLTGTRLERAVSLLNRLNQQEQEFLQTSLENREKVRLKAHKRQVRELKTEQRATILLYILLGVFIISIVIVSLLGLVAFERASTAEATLLEAQNNQSLFLANLSRQQLEAGSPQNALLLALESLVHYPRVYNSESTSAIQNALAYPVQETAYLRHGSFVNGAAWSEDESRILSWSWDDITRVWDAISGDEILSLRHAEAVNGAAWSEDESRILSWSLDGTTRVWDAISGGQLLILRHEDSVRGAAWNGDESRLLSWSDDGTTRVWDAISGDQLLILRHEDSVRGAAWNEDESRILSWSWDNTARVWDASSGDEILSLSHEDWVYGAAWNEDESRILSWSEDGTARVWDAINGDQLLILRHEYAVGGAAWNKDESRLLSWSLDDTTRVWDSSTGNELLTLRYEGRMAGGVWNEDGTHILSWSWDGTARAWDATTGEQLFPLQHDDAVDGAMWNRDESRILSWSRDGTARVWDVTPNLELLNLQHKNILAVAWNKDESRILSWSADGTTHAWDTTTGEQLFRYKYEHVMNESMWNGDGTRIISWSQDGTVWLWDIATGDELVTLTHDNAVGGVNWNKDESRILSWSSDGTTRVWDATTGGQLLILRHEYGVSGAVWSKDESRILSWSSDGTIRVWDATTGEQLLSLQHNDVVRGANWNKNENRILSWSSDGTARVWDATTGEQLLSLQHNDVVRGAKWNVDESRILSWSDDGTARVWDVAGDELFKLKQGGAVLSANWNRDEKRILSWSTYGIAWVWDATTGKALLNLSHEGDLRIPVWNNDGTRILSFSNDGVIKVWPRDTVELITLGQSRVTHQLSNQQRRQFFLPSLVPPATIFVPSVTPLPTFTPSATGQPTITPLPTLTPSSTPIATASESNP
jgi:WD40 repeat protein